MVLMYSKGISPDAHKFYALLGSKGAMTIHEISSKMHKLPTAIYRLAYYLIDLGLITKTNKRPITFQALPSLEGQENYFAYQKGKVDDLFSLVSSVKTDFSTEKYEFSFIQGRNNIFNRVTDDLKKAKNEAHFIVLGLPIGISPDLLLEQKKAVERGIPVKIVIQELNLNNRNTLESWQKQGLELRLGQSIGFHLLLIDDLISYLMSYDSQDKIKRCAVRIFHKQINIQLQKIFLTIWKKAKPINLIKI